MEQLPPVIKALLNPHVYPYQPYGVKLIQTHISYIFLTGSYVFKVKKPVDLGFLDFTTLDKRYLYCKEEIRLNRRLSPEIYMDVVEIKKDGDQFNIGGSGELIEVAVKMRELPQEKTLARLLEKGQVTEDMIDDLARVMADFHQGAESSPRISEFGEVERVFFGIEENFKQTEKYIGITLSHEKYHALKEYSYKFLEGNTDLFQKRIEDGKIRDCHGDFHCENVYFVDKIYVLDCIEFNERFRYIDTACDMAFLIMDLDYRGYSEFSNRLLNTYLQFTGDYGLVSVLNFYKIYRAYVRGKVGSFKLDMEGPSEKQRAAIKREAKKYFDLAYQYVKKKEGPFLLTTTGVMGSGKTYVSQRLASRIDAVIIHSDAMRKKLACLSPTEHRYEPYGKGIYSEAFTRKVYDQLLKEAKDILNSGKPVILDGSFSKKWQRDIVIDFAKSSRYPYLFIHCSSDDTVIKRRLSKRKFREHNISNGRLELLKTHKAEYEAPHEIDPANIYEVNTEGEIERAINHIERLIKRI